MASCKNDFVCTLPLWCSQFCSIQCCLYRILIKNSPNINYMYITQAVIISIVKVYCWKLLLSTANFTDSETRRLCCTTGERLYHQLELFQREAEILNLLGLSLIHAGFFLKFKFNLIFIFFLITFLGDFYHLQPPFFF